MSLAREPDEVLALINHAVVGRTISMFEVFGINSLKSVTPSPSDLAGKVVTSGAFDEAGLLHLSLQGMYVEIDLARTGGIGITSVKPVAEPGPRPTARLLFSDGTCLEFKEPAKTKRITFCLVDATGSS